MDTSVCGRCGCSREGSTMMAEGDGEVKREAVEAGAGGRPTGAREPAGEEVAQQGPAAEPRR